METTIHGHTVSYESNAELGVRYLIYRAPEEVKVFFDQAYAHGEAVFEDHAGTKFKLVKNGYTYQLIHA
jgi:hypothetical protein